MCFQFKRWGRKEESVRSASSFSFEHSSLFQPCFGLRVMGGQIDQRTLGGKSQDAVLCLKSNSIVSRDATQLAIEKELLRKAHVAGKKEGRLTLDHHRDVPLRVTWGGNEQHIATLC